MAGERSFLRIRQTPSPLIVALRTASSQHKVDISREQDQLTIKQPRRKVDAHIPVPGALSSPLHCTRYRCRIHFLNPLQETILRPEPHNDFRYAEEKGLDPEFHEFAFKIYEIAIMPNLGRGLEFYPFDRASICWLRIPYCNKSVLA